MSNVPFWENESFLKSTPLRIEGRYDIAHVLQHKIMSMGHSVSVDIEHPDDDHFTLHGMNGSHTICVEACDKIVEDIQSLRDQIRSRMKE